MAVTASGGHF